MRTVEYRKIESGESARLKIISGVNALANVVKSTLGPNGRTVILEQNDRVPVATKDGVSVAQSIFLGEPVANIAAQIVKEVANNTNNIVGDGTTTATVMVQALLSNLDGIDFSDSLLEVQSGMLLAKKMLLDEVKKSAILVSDHSDRERFLRHIVSISSNNDSEITRVVMEAFDFIGDKGALKVDMGRLHKSYVTKSEGMVYNSGMTNAIFATDIKKTISDLNDPLLFLTDHTIDFVSGIQGIFEYARENERSILVLASDYSSAADMSFYKMKDVFGVKVCCVKAPGFGSQRADILNDIAVMTGAVPIIKGSGTDLEDVAGLDLEMILGSAERISVTHEDFTIINGKGGKDVIDGRVEMLKDIMDDEEDGYVKDQLASRIAKLVHGVAIIYVGAETEFDAHEKMDRYIDSVKAIKAAVKEGVVAGGGLALASAASSVRSSYVPSDYSAPFLSGFNAVLDAVKAPLLQILLNAYLSPEEIYKKIEEGNFKKGFNVLTKDFEDFIETGILDPAMVPSIAVSNAVSLASTLMTTDHVVYNYMGEPETYN